MSALTDLRHNTLVTMVRTWLRGEPVGADEFGNRYYRARGAAGDRRAERRWVVYAGLAEPTRVPPGWHGWVRGTIERPPMDLLHLQPRMSIRLFVLFECESLWPRLECAACRTCRAGAR